MNTLNLIKKIERHQVPSRCSDYHTSYRGVEYTCTSKMVMKYMVLFGIVVTVCKVKWSATNH